MGEDLAGRQRIAVDVAQPTHVARAGARRSLPATLRALPPLSPSLLWLGIFYLVPLGILLLHSIWSTDTVDMVIVRQFTLSNYQDLATDPVFRNVALRTLAMALGVTLTDVV